MRRRRVLALACAALTGCTSAGYQAAGPRTPPRAPPTDTAAAVDPVESRAQAVIRPLNEAYRVLRDPLTTFDVADVTRADLSAVERSLSTAREAVTTFAAAVTDPPAPYRSLPTLVTAHERLFDALTLAVELVAAFSQFDDERVDQPTNRLDPLRSTATRFASTGDDLRDVAETDPTVPNALFLTHERMRAFAVTLDTQSMAVERLLDGWRSALRGTVDWRAGVAAFEREAFEDARTAFAAARLHYRTATDSLADDLAIEGSFADLIERHSCRTRASLEAATTALDAVDTARNGAVARATQRLQRAKTTRNRCETG